MNEAEALRKKIKQTLDKCENITLLVNLCNLLELYRQNQK